MSTLSHRCSRALAVALSAICCSAAAQGTIHFFTYENDVRFHTDRFYTSGVQWSTKDASDTRGPFARRMTGAVCGWLDCADGTLLTSQANLGQLIYTPRDITRPEPQPLDHPWAGLLYYEQIYALLSSDRRTLTTLTGQAGFTGRLSLAEPAQKLLHHILGSPQPQGWDNQVGGSLAVLASAERRSAFDAMSADLGRDVRLNTATYWRVAVGNIQTYAAAGVAIVIGKDLPAVSPPPPGIGNKVRSDGAGEASVVTSCMARWIQCTAFGSLEGRLVAYNVFLDGRLFEDDPSVQRRNFVHDLVVGTRFDFPGTRSDSHGPWFLQFKATRRSPEFRSSLPVPRHRVAALTIGTEF